MPITRLLRIPGVTLGIVVLLAAPALTQSSEYPWTAVGSTGTVDETSMDVVEFAAGAARIKSSVTSATAFIRYNVVWVPGLIGSATGVAMTIQYTDNGSLARVTARLKEFRANGTLNDRIVFDSNLFGQQSAPQTRTVKNCAGNFFNFYNNTYYVEVQLSKTGSAGTPTLWFLRIALLPTSC